MKIEKKAKVKTKKKVKEINEAATEDAAVAVGYIKDNTKKQKKEAKTQVEHTSEDSLTKTMKELDQAGNDQEKMLTKLREQSGDTADEVLDKIETNAHKVSANSAQMSVDNRMDEFYNESMKVQEKERLAKELGVNATELATKVEEEGVAAAEAAEHEAKLASRSMAAKVKKIAEEGVRLANELHGYAEAAKKAAREASDRSVATDKVQREAAKTEERAKLIAVEAEAIAKKNRAKLEDIRKQTEEAGDTAAMAQKIAETALFKTTPKGINETVDPLKDVKGLMKRCTLLKEGEFNISCAGNTMYECVNLDYCRWCPKMMTSPLNSPCVPRPSVKCIWAASPTVPYTFAADKCPWQTTEEVRKAFINAEKEAAKVKKERAAKEAAHHKLMKKAKHKAGLATTPPPGIAPAPA